MADDLSTNQLLLVIIAILLPPLAVYLKTKSLGMTLLCVLLWCLGLIPGLLMALWVVLKG
ncbi:MAG: YqaE/Pmp3 family membrane protein [Phycisphaerales bacterium]|nr:YqaE/Pmp3 family membrane protein [Phycisphaerales bacterium]